VWQPFIYVAGARPAARPASGPRPTRPGGPLAYGRRRRREGGEGMGGPQYKCTGSEGICTTAKPEMR